LSYFAFGSGILTIFSIPLPTISVLCASSGASAGAYRFKLQGDLDSLQAEKQKKETVQAILKEKEELLIQIIEKAL